MPPPPVITLTTDFGLRDAYVAAMKGAILRVCPEVVLVDVTHLIAPQDLGGGAIALERAVASFDPPVVHVAVVDPGVGTERRLLVAEVKGQSIVCPDNGLITWTIARHGLSTCRELLSRPADCSNTFHGRDVMAPAAAQLAAGTLPEAWLGETIEPALLDLSPTPLRPSAVGRVIHIDAFGNATTNLLAGQAFGAWEVTLAGRSIGPIHRTYAEVQPGAPLALIGSSDLLEIAIRNGSAAKVLAARVGTPVVIGPSVC